jgi:DNA-binding beta-propeller fold protein YncE
MSNTGSTDQRDLHLVELTTTAAGAKRNALLSRRLVATLATLSLLFLAACSTPGPGHAYLYSRALGETIRDIDPLTGAERSALLSRVAPGEQVLGITYDPYTDHLFIRLFPGNHVRVVDRPANAIKRSFIAPNLPMGGHDLAIRSRDRHLFYTDPTAPALFETDLNGKLENYLPLEGLTLPPWGVAHDAVRNELLVLPTETSTVVKRFTAAGRAVGEVTLAAPVRGISLAFDADARTYFASLADGSAIGVFDEQGRLLRRLSRPSSDLETFIDVGPRSLLRLF